MPETEITVNVRNYHTDGQGHVNNARYLEFFEEGSWNYLEKTDNAADLLKSLSRKGIVHVMANLNCNCRSPAGGGDKWAGMADIVFGIFVLMTVLYTCMAF